MVSDFLLLQSCFNLDFLLFKKQKELAELDIFFEIATYFKYEKIEKKYQIGKYLLDQIQKKVLSIKETLYLSYELLFMFDNATSCAVYTKNTLQIVNMNKNFDAQQIFLRFG